MRTLLLCIAVLFLSVPTLASVQRIHITSENQSDSELEFVVKISDRSDIADGYKSVVISLPKGQKNLSELWRIYLWVGKPSLSVPVHIVSGLNQELEIYFSASVNTIRQTIVAIRCGKNAPLSEKIYQIDLGTYIEPVKTYNKQLNKDAAKSAAPVN